jgi:hypothetical protein
VSKKLLAFNIALAGLAVFLGAWVVRDLTASRPLPPPPAPRKAAAPPTVEEPAPENAAEDRLAAYNVIVAKYLFNPSRAEGGVEVVKPAVPLPPKPLLLGVVVDGKASRAYLEDPATKRVFGYQVGDSVAGGKLEKIADDRVQISRTDGRMEVMLRDPTKPKPPAPPPAQVPGQPAVVQPPQQPPTEGIQGAPPLRGRPPLPSRSLRRIPVEQQPSSDR